MCVAFCHVTSPKITHTYTASDFVSFFFSVLFLPETLKLEHEARRNNKKKKIKDSIHYISIEIETCMKYSYIWIYIYVPSRLELLTLEREYFLKYNQAFASRIKVLESKLK